MDSTLLRNSTEAPYTAGTGDTHPMLELRTRPPRRRDPVRTSHVLADLASALASQPDRLPGHLLTAALELCQAGSAGLCVPHASAPTHFAAALAGAWTVHGEICSKSAAAPCAEALRTGEALLITTLDQHFPALGALGPKAHACLLVPFCVQGEPAGVIWVASHEAERTFDGEDLRLLESLSHFASAALRCIGVTRATQTTSAQQAQLPDTAASSAAQASPTLLEFERQRAFVERLTRVMPNTLHLFSRNEQRNVWINRHLGAQLGYLPHDIAILGEAFLLRVLHPDDIPALALHQERVFQSADGDVLEFEFRARDYAGHWRWMHEHDTVFRRDSNGYVLEIVGTVADITERKASEATLQAVLRLAEEANRSKADFLSRMSHELRSPLSAMLGFAQLLESGSPAPNPSQQESIAEILKAGWYLLGLISEILDLSLMETEHLALAVEPVELHEVLHDCHAIIDHQAKACEVALLFPEADASIAVFADRIRLKQVLINLLSNAVKYNHKGGQVQLHVVHQPPTGVRICIDDNGIGLLPSQLAHVFQPFERLGQEHGRVEGTGIGLAVSKGLVERMGGQIGVESTINEGSRFWVELIAADHNADAISERAASGGHVT